MKSIFYLLTTSLFILFFFSSRRRHTRCLSDWSSDVCSSDLTNTAAGSTATGRDWQVRARAVISAGGAFGTPELLLRSGIRHPALGRHLHIQDRKSVV